MVQKELLSSIKLLLAQISNASAGGKSSDGHLELLSEIAEELEKASTSSSTDMASPYTHDRQRPRAPETPQTSLSSLPSDSPVNVAPSKQCGLKDSKTSDDKRDILLYQTLERCSLLERRLQELEAGTSAPSSSRPTPSPLAQQLDLRETRRLMALEVELEAAKGRISDLTSQLQDCRLELARAQARETKQRERAEVAETALGNVREIERNLQSKYAAVLGERQKWERAAEQATGVAERAEGAVRGLQHEVAALKAYREENQSLKRRLAEALEEGARAKERLQEGAAANLHLRSLVESTLSAPQPDGLGAAMGQRQLGDEKGQDAMETPLLDRFIAQRSEDEARLAQLRQALAQVRQRQAQLEQTIRAREERVGGGEGAASAVQVDPELRGLWDLLQQMGSRVRHLSAMLEAGERALGIGSGGSGETRR